MKIKMFFKRNVSVFSLALLGFATSAQVTLAEWGAGYNSATGGISVGVGSSGSGAGNVWGGGSYGGGWSLTNPYGLPSGSILGIISNLLYWLLAVFAIAGIIGFVLSGIFYLLAGADEGNAKKGKSGMTASIIGIIVGLSGFVIMQAVAAFLGGGSKTF